MAKSTTSKMEIKKVQKPPIMVTNSKGEQVRLLRPDEKGKKFAMELKEKRRRTNTGKIKKDELGNDMSLTNSQKAYRAGYLQAREDSAMAYNYKNNKPAYDKAKEKKRNFWASRRNKGGEC